MESSLPSPDRAPPDARESARVRAARPGARRLAAVARRRSATLAFHHTHTGERLQHRLLRARRLFAGRARPHRPAAARLPHRGAAFDRPAAARHAAARSVRVRRRDVRDHLGLSLAGHERDAAQGEHRRRAAQPAPKGARSTCGSSGPPPRGCARRRSRSDTAAWAITRGRISFTSTPAASGPGVRARDSSRGRVASIGSASPCGRRRGSAAPTRRKSARHRRPHCRGEACSVPADRESRSR